MNILLIHGYSGSPKNFGNLKKDLEHEGHTVSSPQLPHHETMSELAKHSFEEFLAWMQHLLGRQTKPVILIGYSLGAQLAELCSEYACVHKIVSVCPPVRTKFPYNQSWLAKIPFLRHRIVQVKHPSPLARHHVVPVRGIEFMAQGRKALRYHLNTKPTLKIFLQKDVVSDTAHIPPSSTTLILPGKGHNPFEQQFYERSKKRILEFLKE